MELARAGRAQIRASQAPADVRHDGVGQFFKSTTQGRCKVCQKKNSYKVYKMQGAFAQIKGNRVLKNVP